MPAYATLNQVKTSLAIEGALNGTQDDAFLTSLISRASQYIDTHTRRTFTGTVQTRYFDPLLNTYQARDLLLDEDLQSAYRVVNGDNATIPASDYILLPPNHYPKYGIRIKQSSTYLPWTFSTTPENSISISGTWGYSLTPPDDIVQATVRITVWYYKLRNTPFLEVGSPELDFNTVAITMPNDIRLVLDKYQRNNTR